MESAIITAWAEYARGPGWANQPLWYIVEERSEKGNILQRLCLQPSEQGAEILTLYAVCAAAHSALLSAITRQLAKKKPKRKEA